MSSTVIDDLRLPPFFPLKLRKCADVSDAFFNCFNANSIPNGESDVGRKALLTCSEQLKLYTACMEKHKSKLR